MKINRANETKTPVMRLLRFSRPQLTERTEQAVSLPHLEGALPVIDLIELRQWDVVRKLPRHEHECLFHLDHFIDGQGTYMIGNRLYSIAKNAFYFVPPQTPHQLNIAPGSNMVHLSIKFLYPDLDPSYLPKVITPEPAAAKHVQTLLQSAAELLFDDERQTLTGSLQLAQALVELHRQAAETQQTAREHVHVVVTKRYMEEHFAEHITLDDLARQAGVVGPHLCRVFKHETGLTPFEYLRNIRLSCAKYWLSQTEERLASIAQYTGFGTAQEMGRAFRKMDKMSPRQFRKLCKKFEDSSENE